MDAELFLVGIFSSFTNQFRRLTVFTLGFIMATAVFMSSLLRPTKGRHTLRYVPRHAVN